MYDIIISEGGRGGRKVKWFFFLKTFDTKYERAEHCLIL